MTRRMASWRTMGIIALAMLLLVAFVVPAYADESVPGEDTGLGGEGSLTVVLDEVDENGNMKLNGGWVALYLVGVPRFDEDGRAYFDTRDKDYVNAGKIVLTKSEGLDDIRDNIRTDEELDAKNAEYADAFACEAKDNKLPFLCAPQQIRNGYVKFTNMIEGLYLVIQTQKSRAATTLAPISFRYPISVYSTSWRNQRSTMTSRLRVTSTLPMTMDTTTTVRGIPKKSIPHRFLQGQDQSPETTMTMMMMITIPSRRVVRS